MQPRYEDDFYGWAMANASLLKQGKLKEADMEHIIEELEEMGSSNESQLISRLSLVLCHLLKWQFQPNMRGHSWTYTLEEQRKRTKIHLKKNPSLKSKINECLIDAYDVALSKAAGETGLDKKTFPAKCPYTFEEIINDEFYPDEHAGERSPL